MTTTERPKWRTVECRGEFGYGGHPECRGYDDHGFETVHTCRCECHERHRAQVRRQAAEKATFKGRG